MATPATLRRDLATLTNEASRDVSKLWTRATSTDELVAALHDTLPAVVDAYGQAAASVSADWYDDLRAGSAVRGRFSALTADIRNTGTHELVGWAANNAVDDASLRALIDGGAQRRVLNFSRKSIMDSSLADPAADGWQRTGVGECEFCEMLIGRGAVYKESTVDFAAHDNCFPAGVITQGPSVEVGFRRWYEGEIVIIRTADGNELPVTPNHPILTPFGWRAAGALLEGDDVIQRTGADLADLRVPHKDDVPSPIEDVWSSNRMDRLRSVPVSSQDFHGDAGLRESNVDIVAVDRLLADGRDIETRELVAQVLGAGAGSPAVLNPFPTLGHSDAMSVRLPLPSHRRVCRRCQSRFFFGREAIHTGISGLGSTSRLDARQGEPSIHHAPAHAVDLRKSLGAFSRSVPFGNIGRHADSVMTSSDPPVPGSHAPPNESFSNPVTALPPEDGRNLIERLSGGVQPVRIVELARSYSSGHVYNLQTSEGWYDANSIIVHNCKCSAVPAFKSQPRPVKPRTPSQRGSDADEARAKAWIAKNL